MIVPSIDIQQGRAVQLRGGKFETLDLGDPMALAERYSRVGEIAIVDLDAARGIGDNSAMVMELARRWPCRVGGGIRTRETALRYLDAGARALMIGTKDSPDFLSEFPRERLIAALDIRGEEIFDEGWKHGTGQKLGPRMAELADHVGGFLVTFIENEGNLRGLDLRAAEAILAKAKGVRVTFAGGAAEPSEIAALDRIGADVQAGTAIALGKLDLGAAFAAPLITDREDGFWPTIVADEGGETLGLVWSDLESLSLAVKTGKGVYRSRKRGIWIKGEESGASQELVRIETDCDRDALRFIVRQSGTGFCHTGSWSCFGERRGLGMLERTIAERKMTAPEGSYTRRLFDSPTMLASKLREEAAELANTIKKADAISEAADVFYFTLVKLAAEGATVADVEAELDRRSRKITRRGGNVKPAYAKDSREDTWAGLH
ncbi:MAG: phosphoribosyl-ATP diphosphatase [Spirochaetota bacterium]